MKKTTPLEKRIRRTGYIFMLPWIFGALFFFLIPFLKSVIYAFSDIKFGESGIITKWVSFDNFKYILFQDSEFTRSVVKSVQDILLNVPIIMFFSLFIALILNQKFFGRTAMRAVFFLPVIIASGMVIKIVMSDVFATTGMEENTEIFRTDAIAEVLSQLNLSQDIITVFSQVTSQIFDLTWKSGLQILIYLSAIQTVPDVYYEVASVEGANAWDAFWKITFPVLSPASLLVIIYSIIDTFTDFNNTVMQKILQRIDSISYGYASASAMLYFLVISAAVGLVYLFARKRVFYNNG